MRPPAVRLRRRLPRARDRAAQPGGCGPAGLAARCTEILKANVRELAALATAGACRPHARLPPFELAGTAVKPCAIRQQSREPDEIDRLFRAVRRLKEERRHARTSTRSARARAPRALSAHLRRRRDPVPVESIAEDLLGLRDRGAAARVVGDAAAGRAHDRRSTWPRARATTRRCGAIGSRSRTRSATGSATASKAGRRSSSRATAARPTSRTTSTGARSSGRRTSSQQTSSCPSRPSEPRAARIVLASATKRSHGASTTSGSLKRVRLVWVPDGATQEAHTASAPR